jgi:hypothetical protein
MNDTHTPPPTPSEDVIARVTEQLQIQLASIDSQRAALDSQHARITRALQQLRDDAEFASAWTPPTPPAADDSPSVIGAGLGDTLAKISKAAATTNGKRAKVRGAQAPLREVLIDVVRASQPATATQITRNTLATGYATNAKHFTQVVYMALKKGAEFKRNADGTWSLRKAGR